MKLSPRRIAVTNRVYHVTAAGTIHVCGRRRTDGTEYLVVYVDDCRDLEGCGDGDAMLYNGDQSD